MKKEENWRKQIEWELKYLAIIRVVEILIGVLIIGLGYLYLKSRGI